MNHTLVLVDDVPEIRRILRLILEHAGPFQVVGEGSHGEEAVRLAGELSPDMLVMDIDMRGGPSGWDVLPRVREASPTTVVVILSGSSGSSSGPDKAALADAVLEKGLPPEELTASLLALLGEPRSTRQAMATAAPANVEAAVEVGAADRSTGLGGDARLAALLDATSDAVIWLTAAGVITSWNAEAERMYGRSAAEVTGSELTPVVTSDASGDTASLVARAAAGERIDGAHLTHRGADGAPLAVSLTLVPLDPGPSGARDPAEILVVLRDLSLRRDRDEALSWAVAQLEHQRRNVRRAADELQAFASAASHDLAQPLQVAYGYLEMLRDEFGDGLDPTASSWVDSSIASLERMRKLVQDILTFARAGSRPLARERVELGHVATAAAQAIEDLVTARGAKLRLEPLPVVHASEPHLQLVLTHLLDNAVRFVPEGRTPEVTVSADASPTEWVVSVADNGPGIEAGSAQQVFDVFHRGPRTSAAGTGLGLSVCRKVIANLGGTIWVEEPADGATSTGAIVRFTVPRDPTLDSPATVSTSG